MVAQAAAGATMGVAEAPAMSATMTVKGAAVRAVAQPEDRW